MQALNLIPRVPRSLNIYILQLTYSSGICLHKIQKNVYFVCIAYFYVIIHWYSRLDSDRDAVWKMINPHRTDG